MDGISRLFIGSDKSRSGNTFLWTVTSGIVYALSSLIFLVVVSYFMGKSEVNVYSAGMVISQQMLTLGKYSVRNFQVSDVRSKYSFEDYFTFRILTCLVMILITTGWVIYGNYSIEEVVVIGSMTIYKLAECISDVFEGLYQQKFRFDVSGKSQFTKNMVMILTFVGMVVITRDLVQASIALAVVSILLIFLIDVPLTRNFGKIRIVFRFRVIRELVVACFSLFLSSFLYVYINNAPKYSLAALDSKAEQSRNLLGTFNCLFMPVFVVDLLAGFTMRIWLTKMALYHDEGDRKKFKKIIRRQFGMVSLITVGSMGFMYLFGGLFLSILYGKNFYGYEWTMVLLMLSGGLVAFYTLYENVIIIYRHQHLSIAINIISALFAAVIVPIFTKSYGIMGATVAYLAANGVRALCYFAVAQYYMMKDKKLNSVVSE